MEPRRILIATMPFDGHVRPLTGIARHLADLGHDVRWYTGPSYAETLAALDIPHYPFHRATEITGDNLADEFPERRDLKGMRLIRFEFKNVFARNVRTHFEDVREIHRSFPFDLLLCDAAWFAFHLVRHKIGVPVYPVNVAPLMVSSRDVPPNFTGLTPAKTAFGKFLHRRMRVLMEGVSLRDGTALYNDYLAEFDLPPLSTSIFDLQLESATRIFQSGVPGFDFPRSDLSPKVTYTGPLLPHRPSRQPFEGLDRLRGAERVVLVSQGTVDNKEPAKLIEPTIEALRDRGYLLLVTTGGENTPELRRKFGGEHILVEDFVEFDLILDHVDVFVCNGGYGSVLLGLSHGVPLVTAGIREGKNDINARVRYAEVGVDLRTEQPRPDRIRAAVETALTSQRIRANVERLRREFLDYDPYAIITGHLTEPEPVRR